MQIERQKREEQPGNRETGFNPHFYQHSKSKLIMSWLKNSYRRLVALNSLPWPGWEAGRQIYRPRYIACSTSLVVISEQIIQNVIRQFAFISNQICPVRKAKTIFTNAVRKTKTRGATRESRDRDSTRIFIGTLNRS